MLATGGPGQDVWEDPIKYKSDNGNIDPTISPGDVKLKYLEDPDWTVNYTADVLPDESDPVWIHEYDMDNAGLRSGN